MKQHKHPDPNKTYSDVVGMKTFLSLKFPKWTAEQERARLTAKGWSEKQIERQIRFNFPPSRK